MTNKYPGKCFICQKWVEAGEGRLENEDGRWFVSHYECHSKPDSTGFVAPRVRKADGRIERPTQEILREAREVRADFNARYPERENFARIVELLTTAKANGQKYPSIDFDLDGLRVQIRLAGEKSKNPGSVTVTDGGRYPNNVYYGRIAQDGAWFGARACEGTSVEALLKDLNAAPAKFAGEYGRTSGHCCFCATEITHESSIEVGYGPICAGRFGLPHGGY